MSTEVPVSDMKYVRNQTPMLLPTRRTRGEGSVTPAYPTNHHADYYITVK